MDTAKSYLLFICIICFFCTTLTHASNNAELNKNQINNIDVHVDYSKQLEKFLETKSQLDKNYSFSVNKKNGNYHVTIKHNNNESIKKIPHAYVDSYFQQNNKESEKNILNIIFIPGKK